MIGPQIAISIHNLGKRYRVYNAPKDKLKEVLFLGRRTYHREFWALKDVSLDIGRGETVGVVGRNGSGKSTLLQIVCGTLAPSEGFLQLSGRLSALLELGSGFNPEFTGKENVYMASSILGLCREEIDSRYEAIIRFAGIGDFIHQPVKTYSSGMYLRLAFAVAVAVEPQILVVDEALAVGDEGFQRKCYSRIRELGEQGCTILLVSHNGGVIVDLCDRALLLDRGEQLLSGNPKEVVGTYHKLISAPNGEYEAVRAEIQSRVTFTDSPADTVEHFTARAETFVESCEQRFYDPALQSQTTFHYVSRGARIFDPIITTPDGQLVNNLESGQEYLYTYKVIFTEAARRVRFGMLVKTITGFELGGAAHSTAEDSVAYIAAGTIVSVELRFSCLLLPGVYFLNCGVIGLVDGEDVFLARCIDAVMFRVQPVRRMRASGIIDFHIAASIKFDDQISTEAWRVQE